MFSHSEGETKESHEQENDEERQQDRIVNQKAEADCGQDRQQRGKPEKQSAANIEPTTPTLSLCLFQKLFILRSRKVSPDLCSARWRRFSAPRPSLGKRATCR